MILSFPHKKVSKECAPRFAPFARPELLRRVTFLLVQESHQRRTHGGLRPSRARSSCALRAPGVPFLLVQERNQRRTRGDTPRPRACCLVAFGKDSTQSVETERYVPRDKKHAGRAAATVAAARCAQSGQTDRKNASRSKIDADGNSHCPARRE